VPSAAFADTQFETQIAGAFVRLGMPQQYAACYGRVIDQRLDPGQARRAAWIVESARNIQEVQAGVMNGGMNMINAFSSAHNYCGL
jgi:hypothetical protein